MRRFILVGCGNMGGALLRRWLQILEFEALWVVCPREISVSQITTDPRVHWRASLPPVLEEVDGIIFAVKPQQLSSVLPLYKSYVSDKTLFITVAAGKNFSFYHSYLGTQALIVRAMPNTPCALGAGIVLAAAASPLSETQHHRLQTLLASLGQVQWFAEEETLDICTALTGCGPAYIFQFMESLTAAAVSCGLDPAMVETLVPALLRGSLSYSDASEHSMADLRTQVTSPQGMTEAALTVLRDPVQGLEAIFKRTLQAALDRSQVLRSLNE